MMVKLIGFHKVLVLFGGEMYVCEAIIWEECELLLNMSMHLITHCKYKTNTIEAL